MTDWSKVPSWAKFRATDSNGGSYFYEKKPYAVSGFWACDINIRWEQDCNSCPNWLETLEERPKKPEIGMGGVYRTRDGRKAWVLASTLDEERSMHGAVLLATRLALCRWDKDGKCNEKLTDDWDLVEEWK